MTNQAGAKDYEPTKIYLSILMDEYKVVREHGRQANIFRSLIMQVGTAACFLALSAAFTQWPNDNGIAPLILLLVIPFFSAVTLLTWVGEAHVFGRSREYACLLESKVQLIVKGIGLPAGLAEEWPSRQREVESLLRVSERDPLLGPLSWEQWGRHQRPASRAARLRDNIQRVAFSAVRFMFFPVLMAISLVLGQIQLKTYPSAAFGPTGWLLIILIAYAVALTSAALGLYAMWTFRPLFRQSWLGSPESTHPSTRTEGKEMD